jgi:hypothetical protein
MACPQCGFDGSTVSPADATVALRSFPRRFRELLAPDPDDADPALFVEAGRAAEAIRAIGADLHAVLVTDDPMVSTDTAVATSPIDPGDATTALDRLAAAATQVADEASRQAADAWHRRGRRPSGSVTALDLLREAVHAGIHHLRVIQG